MASSKNWRTSGLLAFLCAPSIERATRLRLVVRIWLDGAIAVALASANNALANNALANSASTNSAWANEKGSNGSDEEMAAVPKQ